MQQQQGAQSAQGSRRIAIFRIGRIVLFAVLLLAAIVTGVLAIATGATSTSTALSGALTVILAVVAVIQIYPILFPAGTDADPSTKSNPPTAPANNTGQNTGVKAGQPVLLFNLPLRDPREYYGRAAARATLISRTSNGGSSSIVGERRSGKTWLMEYVQLIATTHSLLGPTYRIGYVSATHPQSKTLAGFVQRSLEALKVPQQTIQSGLPPLSQLSQGVHNLRDLGIHPVLCIDEFEGFDNRQEFNEIFFEGLRALAQDDGLILITASRRPLHELIEHWTGQTSPFFNIVQQISLRPFNEQEARDFVRNKGDEAGFDEKERSFFLHHGRLYNANGEPYWPPLRLQLAGQMLLARKQGAAGYQLDDPRFLHEFERQLDEEYYAVVRRT
ncbi:MAG TPA: AAA family ATPase [Ktedonobacteraceae bacterium]|nr:AAA family ATPase [Ktedonobacteraceae bacterium]